MEITVVKVGGSLTLKPKKLRQLSLKLSELAEKHAMIIIPGGGEFADVVRKMDKTFALSNQTSHRMAILGMDQYGLLLTDLIHNSRPADSLESVKVILESGKLSILLPSMMVFDDDDLENSWDVTSDSIAVHIAKKLNTRRVLLITDVDGVYDKDPKKSKQVELIHELTAEQLLSLGKRTSVDKHLPKILLKSGIECCVVNGLHPERIEAVLNGQTAICTMIR